ncbi:thioesterase family protein [Pontibacillus litoralis]|uniref:Thioesterase n=1 Tax=Pontibacillus litoralis JSM 072002 TaxID=1385512 RepID=A0A0A5G198_9BACI|nr:thioesterase [Pontibacillus litoralis]KGX86876.1 thioesterase [Pontibacillus litoralis JSM 072002]
MKSGMHIGQTATITARVTPEMFAQFEGKVVHEAYSTVAMVYHMEWAARQIILPYLEADEEGIGAAVQVKHVAPTAVETDIQVTATLTELRNHLVITEVEAKNNKGIIGKGEVTQAIVPKEVIKEKIKLSEMTQP